MCYKDSVVSPSYLNLLDQIIPKISPTPIFNRYLLTFFLSSFKTLSF